MAIVGIIILAIIIAGILYLRNRVNTQGSPVMKGLMKIGDFFVWIRFIGVGLLLLFLMLLSRKSN